MPIFIISLWTIAVIYLIYIWIKAQKTLKIEKEFPKRIEIIATLVSIPIALLIGTTITMNLLFK